MKKFWLLAATLLFCMMMGAATAAAATATTQLFLNGKALAAEVPPRIISGNTMVPVRVIAENLGAKVTWDEKNRQVTVTRDSLKILLTIDKPEVLVGGKPTKLEVAPTIVDGNTLLPLRFVGEQLGVKFTWDELTRSVFMYKQSNNTSVSGNGGNGPADGKGTQAGTDAGAADGQNGATNTGAGNGTNGNTNAGASNGTNGITNAGASNGTIADASNAVNATGNAGTGSGTNIAYAADPDGEAAVGLVQGIEFSGDRLLVKTSGVTSKPNIFHLGNPERLVMDVPYAKLDDAMKSKLVGTAGEIAVQHPLAQRIRFSNYSSAPATVRIIIDLKQRAQLVPVDAKTLPAGQLAYDLKESKFRVVIDAGHGGKDSGAISVSNKMEKTFTLAMASKVSELLKKESQVEVLMTRTDDTFVALDDRVAFANNQDADLFLSIHGNKYTASSTGTETYYYRDESLDFANVIHKYAVKGTGFPDRGIRKEPFRVIKGTTMPAVLVEVGYLSNKNDEQQMYDDAFQYQVAASLVAAIKEYLNIQ